MKPVGHIAALFFTLACGVLLIPAASAQTAAPPRVRVIVLANDRPARNARVRTDSAAVTVNDSGVVQLALREGAQRIVAMKLGLAPDSITIIAHAGMDTTITMRLAPLAGSLSAIVVTTTLTEQRIEDVPIRVEILAGEDIDEKSSMRPGDLTQMVAEIPGVRVQPLSSGATGASLRVQGFRSQYTQFLVDGLPLTGGNDAGLSLVQIPPLDLAQVEVVKVGASALYGPAALGGVMNFISRRPPPIGEKTTREVLFSGSSYRDLDAVTFLAAPLTRSWGATVLASGHSSPASDRDRDGLADIPQSQRLAIRPRFFWSRPSGSKALITAALSGDRRVNGILPGAISPKGTFFRDSLRTLAGDVGGSLHIVLPDSALWDSRLAIQALGRDRDYDGTPDRDRSASADLQSSATVTRGAATIVGGFAVRQERSRSLDLSGFDYRFVTGSVFTQVSGPLARRVSYSLTGRCDRHSRYGTRCVPLAAVLARPAEGWTIRASGALGTRAPTPFTEESAITGLSRFRPFSGAFSSALEFEAAQQGAVDAGYHLGGFDLNASLYASRIRHAVGIRDLPSGPFAQELAAGVNPTEIRGADFFAVYTGDPLSFTAFYGLLRTREQNLDAPGGSVRQEIPLSPSRRAGLDVAMDIEEIGTRIAVEGYYTGVQSLIDNPYRRKSRPFTTVEALASQKVGRALFFLSGENLTNVRQSSFDPILLPAQARSGRRTTDVWAPLSGMVFRIGARVDYSGR